MAYGILLWHNIRFPSQNGHIYLPDSVLFVFLRNHERTEVGQIEHLSVVRSNGEKLRDVCDGGQTWSAMSALEGGTTCRQLVQETAADSRVQFIPELHST